MGTVRLENIRKVYDKDFVAVHDASLTVNDGEFVVLVGPSGCGKSTMLRMIAGLEDVSAGRLFIDDQLVNEVAAKDRDIAMVFQNYALYPHMTVYDNMAFGLKLRKYPKDTIQSRVRNAAGILGITEILGRKPGQLSGGQRQRVAVGRAIVRNPKVFLFDEPLSNLDAKLRVQMRSEISKLHRRLNATMVYVTHDQVEAMTMGQRIVVLKDGWVQQIDAPLSLYDRPANKFVAGFIGSPAMNFIAGHILRDGGLKFVSMDREMTIDIGTLIADKLCRYIDKRIEVGIRPEHICVAEQNSTVPGQSLVQMALDEVEPMGNEVFIYTSSKDHTLVARVVPQSMPAVGETISLAIDADAVHFFDQESEESILTPPSVPLTAC